MTPHAARTMHAARASVATTRRATLISATLVPLRALLAALMREWCMRRDQRLLAQMCEHELADMGITRAQIEDAVRFGRVSPWLGRD
jgi:uncharacterized protein YjiS (DUF1127 family)